MRQLILYMPLVILLSGCGKKGAEDGTKETGDVDSQTTTVAHGSDTTTSSGDSHTDTSDGKSDTGTGDSAHDDTSSHTDEESSDISSDSVDSATADSDTGPAVQYGEPELLYEFPSLEGEEMMHLEVDDSYIYYVIVGSLYRVDKKGGGEPEGLIGLPTGYRHQSLSTDSEAVYWLSNNNVLRMDKATDEKFLLPFAEEDDEMEVRVLILDDDRIYVASLGCVSIISISKDGGDRIVSERPVEGEVGPITTLALDENYVYCGGGSRGVNMGKLFRCPKEGGEIAEVTTVPEVTDPNDSPSGPQVTGMAVVGDRVYFVSNYNTNSLMQYLGWAPTSGGEYTRIAEIKGISNTQRLFLDAKRNALYFFAMGKPVERGVYKYDLAGNQLTHLTIDGGEEPMAADEDYFYWHDRSKIYRMKKF